jgi:hypothetical protein
VDFCQFLDKWPGAVPKNPKNPKNRLKTPQMIIWGRMGEKEHETSRICNSLFFFNLYILSSLKK